VTAHYQNEKLPPEISGKPPTIQVAIPIPRRRESDWANAGRWDVREAIIHLVHALVPDSFSFRFNGSGRRSGSSPADFTVWAHCLAHPGWCSGSAFSFDPNHRRIYLGCDIQRIAAV